MSSFVCSPPLPIIILEKTSYCIVSIHSYQTPTGTYMRITQTDNSVSPPVIVERDELMSTFRVLLFINCSNLVVNLHTKVVAVNFVHCREIHFSCQPTGSIIGTMSLCRTNNMTINAPLSLLQADFSLDLRILCSKESPCYFIFYSCGNVAVNDTIVKVTAFDVRGVLCTYDRGAFISFPM